MNFLVKLLMFTLSCVCVCIGTSQEMVRNMQNMRNARLLQQQQQQQQMQQLQSGAMQGGMPSQPDMGMPYGGQPGSGGGQAGLYAAGMGQMQQQQQHPNQSSMPMGHAGPAPGHRPPGGGPAGMMPGAGGAGGGGYGQGMLLNSALKGGSQPMNKAQAQRLQSMMGAGGAGWQQQQQQSMQPMGSRTTNEMVGFGGMPAGYGMPPGQGPPRMPKQHYGQGGMVDPRAMNPAGIGPGGAQMMPPHMASQVRTNQPRGMMMPGMNQGVPGSMASAFGQAGGQQGGMGGPGGPGGGGGYPGGSQPQGYQRTSSQDLAYGYASQSTGGSGGQFGLSDGTDMDSSDGWMEEFFPSQ